MRRVFPVVFAAASMLLYGTARAGINLVPGTQYIVTQSPKYIAVADFDQDQHEDVVVTNQVTNRVTVLYGGDGFTFRTVINIDTGRVLRGVAAGDLNSDGCPDIATSDYLDARVFYTFGDKTSGGKCAGTFGQTQSQKVGARPVDVAIGDFLKRNSAGPDLMTVNQLINKVTVLENLGGNRGFNSVGQFDVGRVPKRGIALDLNGDGFDDIVTVNTRTSPADDVSILLNNGTGSFSQPPDNFVVGAGARDVTSADFNNDGTPDLAVLNAGQTAIKNEYSVTILLNRPTTRDGKTVGSGFFDTLTPIRISCPLTLAGIPISCFPHSIAAADFDIDTFADFVVSFYTLPGDGSSVQTSGLLQAYAGSGDGNFTYATDATIGYNPQGIATGDFNGDGVDDIAVALQGSRSVQIVQALRPPLLDNGGDCNVGRQCKSNFCVDGTCCGSATCPSGQRCDIPSSPGICMNPVPNGEACTDLHQCQSGNCVDGFCCGSRVCPAGQFCNTGQCGPPAGNGNHCNADEQCSSTFCVDGFCCADSRCPAGQSCSVPGFEGVCMTKLPNGDACTTPTQCQSGLCIDEFCCERDCAAGESCAIVPGLCRPQPSTPRPTATPTRTPTPAPNGSACQTSSNCTSGNCVDGACCEVPSCPANQSCSIPGSAGVCHDRLDNGRQCTNNSNCTTNYCRPPGICDFPPTMTPTPTNTPIPPGDPCNPNVGGQCSAEHVCNTEERVCCTDMVCPPDFTCRSATNPGTCVKRGPTPTPRMDLGGRCTTPANCADGLFCVDFTCCSDESCPEGERCDIANRAGICSPPLPAGQDCNKNSDCEAGLLCLGNPPRCSLEFTPTPTFVATSVPTQTPIIDLTVNRSGGSCAIDETGSYQNGALALFLLPMALFFRRRAEQRD